MDSPPELQGIEPGSYGPPNPLDPLNPPPIDRYCDLVLKGGVVDGVIYPGALHELARHYRFQSIAGTSVGAIAGSLAAACEFSRRFGSDLGFNEVLRPLADELAKPARPNAAPTKLHSLFQTAPALQRLFAVAVDTLSVPYGQIPGQFVRTALCAYAWYGLAGAAIGSVLAMLAAWFFGGPWVAGVEFALALGLTVLGGAGGLVLGLWLDGYQLAQAPGFGFCSGLSTDGGKTDGLTEWLHKGIQAAARLPMDRPLTFRDLWSAPGGPPGTGATSGSATRSIDLRMIATSVSHGRPYEFPHDPRSTRLFFRMQEFEAYFPPSVMAYLKSPGICSAQAARVSGAELDQFWELPQADLPILVATRLSMNFPLLFKSVPLWAFDEQRGPVDGQAPWIRQAWFSDGGICSNFPIHFFDSPLPAWPTFGIYIDDKRRDAAPAVPQKRDTEPRLWTWLPKFHNDGRAEQWLDVQTADQNKSAWGLGAMLGYLAAVARTAKDWTDHANLRAPGVRERVVYIYKDDETSGGLNLKLGGEAIRQMAYGAGVAAGRSLVDKFLLDPTRQNPALKGAPGWLDHRWVRLNTYLTALRQNLQGFSYVVHCAQEIAPLPEQIRQATLVPPLYREKSFESALTPLQADALQRAVEAIAHLEAQLGEAPVAQPYQPSPQPHLASRPGI